MGILEQVTGFLLYTIDHSPLKIITVLWLIFSRLCSRLSSFAGCLPIRHVLSFPDWCNDPNRPPEMDSMISRLLDWETGVLTQPKWPLWSPVG